MFISQTTIRVRYAETDRMGYVYYGNYATYFEVARVEALRSLGLTYKKIEDEGILLPVLDFHVKYLRPAFYDDNLVIKTMIKELPMARIRFEYEVYRDETLISKAETTLVFVDQKEGKPTPAPEALMTKLKPYF